MKARKDPSHCIMTLCCSLAYVTPFSLFLCISSKFGMCTGNTKQVVKFPMYEYGYQGR